MIAGSHPRPRLAALALLAASAGLAHAEIRFETTKATLRPKPDQEQIEAVFAFENGGQSPIRILSALSSCSCLKTTMTQGEIAPGAKGSVTGIFKTGNFPGLTEKTIQVRVDEKGRQRVILLTVAVEVTELVRVEPRTLAWTAGGDAAEQTFTVKMQWEKPIRLQDVASSNAGFTVRVETVREGGEYRVHVKPADTSKPMLGIFHFKTDCEFEKFAKPLAFAHIRKP
jgi:hypothetical protein